jgi:hypothetical protein
VPFYKDNYAILYWLKFKLILYISSENVSNGIISYQRKPRKTIANGAHKKAYKMRMKNWKSIKLSYLRFLVVGNPLTAYPV